MEARKVSARMLGDRWIHLIDNLSTEIHNRSGWWNLTSLELEGDIDLSLEPEEWELFDKINHILAVPTLHVRVIMHEDWCSIDIGLDAIVDRLDKEWEKEEREKTRNFQVLNRRNQMTIILWTFINESETQGAWKNGSFTVALTADQWLMYDEYMDGPK